MKISKGAISVGLVLSLAAFCATSLLAQNPRNPGIFQQYSAPPSSTLGFLASDAGKGTLAAFAQSNGSSLADSLPSRCGLGCIPSNLCCSPVP